MKATNRNGELQTFDYQITVFKLRIVKHCGNSE